MLSYNVIPVKNGRKPTEGWKNNLICSLNQNEFKTTHWCRFYQADVSFITMPEDDTRKKPLSTLHLNTRSMYLQGLFQNVNTLLIFLLILPLLPENNSK